MHNFSVTLRLFPLSFFKCQKQWRTDVKDAAPHSAGQLTLLPAQGGVCPHFLTRQTHSINCTRTMTIYYIILLY